MKKIALLSGIFLFACNATSKLDSNDFSVILQGEYGGKEEKTHELITNNNDFINAIESFPITEEELSKLISIDFSQHNAIIVHAGQKNNGGYSITIDKIEMNGKELLVYVKESGPKIGENVTMALTNPYCLATIPKTKKVTIK
jgi:hypothetical protein